MNELRRGGHLRTDRVAEAFATVPRHTFLPGRRLKEVYTDRAIITKQIDGMGVSSSSQPAIMAVMLEQLELEPGHRVLEIGAGTGYNAALLARLVGDAGRVTTVDIDPEIADAAQEHLRSAGCNDVRVVAADGGFGYPKDAPYDRIIATASCWQIPQTWVDQLVEGGVLVLPLRLNGAHVCLALRKEGQVLVSRRASMCGFMPLRGAFGPEHTQLTLPDMRIAGDVEIGATLRRSLPRLLQDGGRVKVAFPRTRDTLNSPLYYLMLQGKPVLLLLRHVDGWGDEPFLLVTSRESAISLHWNRPKRGSLTLYGSDEALKFLQTSLASWRDEGRPDLRSLRTLVRPSQARVGPLPRRIDGRYRFRRGDHLYELWFER